MLVLGRKAGESVAINPGQPDEVRVTFQSIHRVDGETFVRLSFEAHPSVKIYRSELLETKGTS